MNTFAYMVWSIVKGLFYGLLGIILLYVILYQLIVPSDAQEILPDIFVPEVYTPWEADKDRVYIDKGCRDFRDQPPGMWIPCVVEPEVEDEPAPEA